MQGRLACGLFLNLIGNVEQQVRNVARLCRLQLALTVAETHHDMPLGSAEAHLLLRLHANGLEDSRFLSHPGTKPPSWPAGTSRHGVEGFGIRQLAASSTPRRP